MTDLWPKDLQVDAPPRTPALILKEQGALLGSKTKNLLEGRVRVLPEGPSPETAFSYSFDILAPTINYRFRLFRIYYGLDLYPVILDLDEDIRQELRETVTVGRWDAPGGIHSGVKAEDEETFTRILAKVLGAEKTRRIISALLGQIEVGTRPGTMIHAEA